MTSSDGIGADLPAATIPTGDLSGASTYGPDAAPPIPWCQPTCEQVRAELAGSSPRSRSPRLRSMVLPNGSFLLVLDEAGDLTDPLGEQAEDLRDRTGAAAVIVLADRVDVVDAVVNEQVVARSLAEHDDSAVALVEGVERDDALLATWATTFAEVATDADRARVDRAAALAEVESLRAELAVVLPQFEAVRADRDKLDRQVRTVRELLDVRRVPDGGALGVQLRHQLLDVLGSCI
jgi:hypothetical protein